MRIELDAGELAIIVEALRVGHIRELALSMRLSPSPEEADRSLHLGRSARCLALSRTLDELTDDQSKAADPVHVF